LVNIKINIFYRCKIKNRKERSKNRADWKKFINPLKAELNPICHLLALLGAHYIFHVSGLRVKESKVHIELQRHLRRRRNERGNTWQMRLDSMWLVTVRLWREVSCKCTPYPSLQCTSHSLMLLKNFGIDKHSQLVTVSQRGYRRVHGQVRKKTHSTTVIPTIHKTYFRSCSIHTYETL